MAVHVRNLTEETAPAWMQTFAAMGGTAVYLFFTVSGWLLFHTWERRSQERPFSPREFWIRRAVRILPLWWILVSIVWWWKELPLAVALAQYTFAFGFVMFDPHWFPIPIAWSLFAEEVLYLVFPLVFVVVRSQRRALIVWLVASALGFLFVVTGRAFGWPQENFFLFRSPVFVAQFFFLGILLWWRKGRTPPAPDLLAALCFAGLWLDRNLFLVPHIITIFHCALAENSWIGSALRKPWVQSFGRYCYAIYLFHILIVDLLAPVRWPLPGWAQFLVLWTLVASLSWCIAHATHRFLEAPLRRWADGRFRSSHSPASASQL